MAISKSTPYVRYKENFTSNLHLGTIHVESEYLDRTQKTTIESIHGMTWHNKVVNENKELDLLSNLGFELTESKKEYFNVGEQRVSVDEIHGMQDIEPNEDGTYTYSVTSIEGEYAEIYDGLNHITSTSDGLDGNFEIVYDTDEEDITGSVVLDATMPDYTIEDSNIGELNDVVFKGETLVNILPQPSLRNEMENTSMQRLNEGHDEVVVADGEYKSAILKGQTLVNEITLVKVEGNTARYKANYALKNGSVYTLILPNIGSDKKISLDFFNYSAGTYKRFFYTTSRKTVFTAQEDEYLKHIVATDGVSINDCLNAILLEGDYTNIDIPYFEGMQSVKMPVLKTTGKNLFNHDSLILNKYQNNENYNYSIADNTQHAIYKLDVKANTTYSLNMNRSGVFYDINNKPISSFSMLNTVTTPNNCKYIIFNFTDYATNDYTKCQIEEGTTSTTYEPYKSNILTVNEEVELRGIGDVKDELNLLTGELTQRIGEIVLNGLDDENWKISNNSVGEIVFNGTVPNIAKASTNEVSVMMCDKIPVVSIADTWGGKTTLGISQASNGNYIQLKLDSTTLPNQTIEGLMAYLRNNPLTLQYQLATPVIKTVVLTVTDQDNVVLEIGKPRSYKDGHIQVQSNGILPSSISYEVPSQNHIHVDMLKPSNTYTLKRNGENFEGSFFIDGAEYYTNVFMTSHQLPNKSLIINDMSENDKVAMFEGNYGTSTIPYFEGMTSVKMPVLTTTGKNLLEYIEWEIDKRLITNGDVGEYIGNNVSNYINVSNLDVITFSGFSKGSHCLYDKDKNPIGGRALSNKMTVDVSGANYIRVTIDNTKDYSNPQMEVGSVATSYEPYKSNILTVNEEVTLRAIGDVKDEYNVETGELTQRIGEVVLDGNVQIKEWSNFTGASNGLYGLLIDDFMPYDKSLGSDIRLICDKLPSSNSEILMPYEHEGIALRQKGDDYNRIYLSLSQNKANDVESAKLYLNQNPLTLQYQLAQPITRKVISTILDQDGKQTHSMSTYTGLTNLSTSSDTLIPNVSLDYEISSSTGTVTGTSATIENGENGSPISAIVYGESLVNNIQEPSDVECVVLGEHSGNNITIENSVEGNIENAVIKGNTLVNRFDNKCYDLSNWDGSLYKTFYFDNLAVGKEYVFYAPFKGVHTERDCAIILEAGDRILYQAPNDSHETINVKFTLNEGERLRFNNYVLWGDTLKVDYPEILILESEYYYDGIPYFEGMQSVEMPVLTTTGKNLLDPNYLKNQCLKISTSALYSNGEIIFNANAYYSKRLVDLDFEPNTQYAFNFKMKGNVDTALHIAVYYKDGTTTYHKPYIDDWIGVISGTTKQNGTVDFITIGYGIDNTNCILYLNDCSLFKSNIITSHEPHKSNILTCNEEVTLHAIDDIKDELDLVTGKLTQRVGEVMLNGSEDWNGSVQTDVAGGQGFRGHVYMSSLNLPNATSSNKVITDKTANNLWAEGIYIHPQQTIYYAIPNTVQVISTVTDFKQYLSQNPITIQYELATPITKTISTAILDQDGNPTSLHSYNDTTHIATNSQGLTANVEISNPSYDVVLKADTKYTLKLNRTNAPTNTPLEINLGGTEATMDSAVNSIVITTPSTLANNKLTMSGVGNKFKEAMIIEGDCVNRELDYFEGIVGVENPILTNVGKNLFNINGDINQAYPHSGVGLGNKKINDDSFIANNFTHQYLGCGVIIKTKPHTEYTVSGHITNRGTVVVHSSSKINLAIYTYENNSFYFTYLNTNDEELCFSFLTNGDANATKAIFSNIQIEESSIATPYEPYRQGNILTTYPQITLRSIGDIKDELDLVNETVTRRIGEIVLDGSEEIRTTNNGENINKIVFKEKLYYQDSGGDDCNYLMCDKLRCVKYSGFVGRPYDFISIGTSGVTGYESAIFIKFNLATTMDEWKDLYSQITPITLYYRLETPITESVRITPPTPRTSTASVTLSTQLGESDFVTWNPYKEHYVHYNYEQDGSYTWDNLTDLNERQFIELYDRRTYVEQEYKNTFLSHDSKGTSKYVLIEPNQDYTVTVRFSELPQCETVKVNLGGSEVEMNVSDPRVHVTTPSTLSNYLCSISGEGLSGKITDILVIHCLEHEGFADIEYFEGIDSIGEVVDGKASIIVEQTNGNLIDVDGKTYDNGNGTQFLYIKIKPNKSYNVKTPFNTNYYLIDKNDVVSTRGSFNNDSATFTSNEKEEKLSLYCTVSTNGSGHTHIPIELCYADMEKDYIRPRYNSSQEIILPMQLCRINTVYDNFYYDVIRGHYRIQQSIGHKYFTGADSENWTLIERGQRILRFRYNNADIQIKSLGEYMTNRFTNGTTTSPYESCAFNGSTFIISIDKERLSNATLTAFKEWLSSHNVHLYYQLASPMMIDLPQYSSKLELNTYKDEIYTFLKNCKPTVFTLDVPLDQTYRFYELQESQGYTNRIELTDERMTEEDALYINTIYGSGISNLIEEPNNVNTLLKPNYEGRATSHTLTNGKVSTISVHGFEPNSTRVGTYNTVTKQYELTVKATSGENNNSVVFPIPYALEQYEDGSHDKVYYNSEYKQWMFEGGQTLTVAYNSSTGAFTNAVEIFRGMMPRSGMIGEFKVKFASGTTSARLYYSLDGSTYTYTTLRSMTDGVDYYIAFFNTGGTKIDMGTKIGADSEYVTLVPLSGTVSEALMINQIQSITECTYYLDKTYYYTEPTRPIELTVYEGTNTITENNGAIITIENNAHNKDALIYANTPYTVYWTYVGGEGNIKVTLGGATQEVAATQGYVTITTSDADLERGLLIGGFDVTIKDLMLVKGERIADLSYFEGSRAVGTAFIDEDGNTMYRITLVTGSELIQDKFEDVIAFEDNKKHNVLVTKLLGTKPDKN